MTKKIFELSWIPEESHSSACWVKNRCAIKFVAGMAFLHSAIFSFLFRFFASFLEKRVLSKGVKRKRLSLWTTDLDARRSWIKTPFFPCPFLLFFFLFSNFSSQAWHDSGVFLIYLFSFSHSTRIPRELYRDWVAGNGLGLQPMSQIGLRPVGQESEEVILKIVMKNQNQPRPQKKR